MDLNQVDAYANWRQEYIQNPNATYASLSQKWGLTRGSLHQMVHKGGLAQERAAYQLPLEAAREENLRAIQTRTANSVWESCEKLAKVLEGQIQAGVEKPAHLYVLCQSAKILLEKMPLVKQETPVMPTFTE